MLSVVWWTQDTKLAPSLHLPITGQYLPHLGHHAMVSPSLESPILPTLWMWQWGNGQEATALCIIQKQGFSGKAPFSQTHEQNHTTGALLCKHPLACWGTHEGGMIHVCQGSWCDNCSSTKPPFSCQERWCSRDHTLQFFPPLLNCSIQSTAVDANRYCY